MEIDMQIWLLMVFLSFYAILAAFLEHRKWPIHRGSVAIVTGIIVGLLIKAFDDQSYKKLVKMNETIIFSVLLPPMLFNTGYNFKRNAFIKNLKYIVVFGVIGTFISFVLMSILIQEANQLNLVRDGKDIGQIRKLSVWEVLLMSACLCSIDTGAAQEAVSKNKYPKLHSIIVGEDVFKDTVTILLFRAILHLEQMETPDEFVFEWTTPFSILLNFIILILCSFLIGLVCGFLTTFMFKKFRFLVHDQGVTETAVLFLLGFATYILTQLASFSGIISILCFGVIMNRLNLYNLSEQGQKSSRVTFSSITTICEGLLFLIMGIMVWQVQWDNPKTSEQISHSWSFVLVVICILFFCRVVNIYLLGFISGLHKKFQINRNELRVIFWGGLVKGATPFALFTSVEINDESYGRNEGLILKTTIITVVTVSSIILNSLMPTIFRKPLGKLQQSAKEYLIEKSQKISNHQKQLKFLQKLESFLKPILIWRYKERSEEIQLHREESKKQLIEEALAEFNEDKHQSTKNLSLLSQ